MFFTTPLYKCKDNRAQYFTAKLNSISVNYFDIEAETLFKRSRLYPYTKIAKACFCVVIKPKALKSVRSEERRVGQEWISTVR